MDYSSINYWINFVDYSKTELIFNGIGCLFWIVCYASFIRSILQNKFVEMPWFIATGNLAWEFLWSFYVHPNTGMLYDLSYKGAFLMDVFIFINVLKYGHLQLTLDPIKKIFKPLAVFTLIGWVVVLYLFIKEGYDDNIGGTSGYLLNIIISILYPVLYYTVNKKELFSITIAWSKWLGTGFISVSLFFIFPEKHMVHILGIFCFILDAHYFFTLKRAKKIEE